MAQLFHPHFVSEDGAVNQQPTRAKFHKSYYMTNTSATSFFYHPSSLATRLSSVFVSPITNHSAAPSRALVSFYTVHPARRLAL